MPIEVRELIVKVNVGTPRPVPGPEPVELAALKRELVKSCVAELRQLLREKAER